MIIGIDKGHSLTGAGGGASKYLSETVENRKIGNELIRMLKEKGHTVVDCSVDSASTVNAQLDGIVKKANAQKLDVFVSIHLNAGGGHGTETYSFAAGGTGRDYAKKINDEVVKSCGFRNRGLKTANFKVLRETVAPAVLLEVCFVDSLEDKDKINTNNVARAIFKAITGTEYVAPTPSQPSGQVFYRVVAGSFTERKNAEDVVNQLKQKGYPAFIDIYRKG